MDRQTDGQGNGIKSTLDGSDDDDDDNDDESQVKSLENSEKPNALS